MEDAGEHVPSADAAGQERGLQIARLFLIFQKKCRYLEFHVEFPKPQNTMRAKQNSSMGAVQARPGYCPTAREPGWEGSCWRVVQAAPGCWDDLEGHTPHTAPPLGPLSPLGLPRASLCRAAL